MPSLASIFSFLEAICPTDSPTWHISRARLLEHYNAAWVQVERLNEKPSLITFPDDLLLVHEVQIVREYATFIFLLPPKYCDVKGSQPKLLAVFSELIHDSERPGTVVIMQELDER